MIHTPERLRCAAVSVMIGAAVCAQAAAGDYVGINKAAGTLFTIDLGVGAATQIGKFNGTPLGGFDFIDRAPNGKLYAIARPGVTGYQVWELDESTLTAKLVHKLDTNSDGQAGLAVDPSGQALWVAGYVGLSTVRLDRVDLATGALQVKGTVTTSLWWDLAFDGSGKLFAAGLDFVTPVLIRVSTTQASLSKVVGPLSGMNANDGIVLSSDRGSGAIHAFSRANDDFFRVDSATGAPTLLATLTNASNIGDVAEDQPCLGSALPFGAGCGGALGIVPSLAIAGCPGVGNPIQLAVSQGLGGSTAILLVGLAQGSAALGAGCSLLVAQPLPIAVPLPLGGAGPGAGSVTVFATVPAAAAGVNLALQAFVIDATVTIGASATQGVWLQIT